MLGYAASEGERKEWRPSQYGRLWQHLDGKPFQRYAGAPSGCRKCANADTGKSGIGRPAGPGNSGNPGSGSGNNNGGSGASQPPAADPVLQFVGTAETRIKPETGAVTVRLAGFPNAWSAPQQVKLNEPMSLEKWKPGDKLELKVKLSGTAAGSAPTRLLFYFNGDSGSGIRIQTGNLTLNEEQTVQLDLSGIVANLGGSLKQIGVLTGYGWPTNASVELWDVKLRIEP